MSIRDELGNIRDPHSKLNIGTRRYMRDTIAPICEYEASGMFSGEPDAVPDPLRVAELGMRVVANRESRVSSPFTDQLEMAYKLADSCSPGHEFLRSPTNPDRTMADELSWVIGGHRKPGGNPSEDAAQQDENPLFTAATVIGSTWDGYVHTRVFAVADIYRAAEDLLPKVRARSWCGFCFVKQIRPVDAAILLRGRGFWIDARVACKGCRSKLVESAQQIGVTLSWVRPPETGEL